MSIEAMRNAVEAMDKHDYEMADHILCQAIAEAEKQEPVAWKSTSGTLCNLLNKGQIESGLWHPLYTHPQPKREWVGLTNAEFDYCVNLKVPEAIAEEIEAKLKEKNT